MRQKDAKNQIAIGIVVMLSKRWFWSKISDRKTVASLVRVVLTSITIIMMVDEAITTQSVCQCSYIVLHLDISTLENGHDKQMTYPGGHLSSGTIDTVFSPGRT